MSMAQKLKWPLLLMIVIGIVLYQLLSLHRSESLSQTFSSWNRYNSVMQYRQPDHAQSNVNDENVTEIFTRTKLIYVHGRGDITQGRKTFHNLRCAVKECSITANISEGKDADLVVFGFFVTFPRKPPFPRKSSEQIWAILNHEAPGYEANFKNYNGMINWTITYRSDSTVHFPYFKFKYFDTEQQLHDIPSNYAEGKSKKVVWLVSNLRSKFRIRYFQDLEKYIQADRIGRSSKPCPEKEMYKCLDILGKTYKFYFSAENSFCNEYMTEKICRNAYKHKMVPIVLGARRDDYIERLPPNSFVMAEDFDSPKHLAEYLHKIDQNDTLYNQFFEYRKYMYAEDQFSPPWCDVCTRLHAGKGMPFWYDDINTWWSTNACRQPPWHLLKI